MYGSVIGVAGAALVVSITALIAGPSQQPPAREAEAQRDIQLDLAKQRQDVADAMQKLEAARKALAIERAKTVNAAVFEPAPPGGQNAEELNAIRFDATMTASRTVDVIRDLAKVVGRPVEFDEKALLESGLDADRTVALSSSSVTFPQALAIINTQLGLSDGRMIDYRVAETPPNAKKPGAIRISSRAAFDRLETRIVSYDLAGIIATRMTVYHEERPAIVAEISKLIYEFVSPDEWRSNGGDLANLSIVGDHMFVSAPARMHPQIKWMLEQLAQRISSVPILSDIPLVGNVFKQSLLPSVRIYPLQRNDATATATRLQNSIGVGETGLWSVKADAGTNSVIVNGSESLQRKAMQVLAQVGEDVEMTSAAAYQIRSYPIKNVNAEEALSALKTNMAIRKIDFSSFTSDSRTNAVLGRVTLEGHGMILAALGDIDTPEFAHKLQTERQAASDIAQRTESLKRLQSEANALKAQLAHTAPESPQTERIKTQINQLERNADMIRQEIENLRSTTKRPQSAVNGAPLAMA